jgi:hypothetical protein
MEYAREARGMGMESDRSSQHLQKHNTNTHASITKIYEHNTYTRAEVFI